MSIVQPSEFLQLVDPDGTADPDDFRPNTSIYLVVDPRSASRPYVDDMVVLMETMAVGDRIPLHRHSIDEVIVIRDGAGESTVGEETKSVAAGSIVFIPAGVAHGTRNTGGEPLRLTAVFPSRFLPIEYLDRNPAPGTEGNPPQPPFTIDVREIFEQSKTE